MKKLRASHVLVVLTVILLVGVTTVAFHRGNNEKPEKDWTLYHWYDAATGDYTWRQSTIDDERQLTGFDESTSPPFTLRERGYTQGNVTGFPPVPTNPYLPAKRLYTHP